MPADAKYKKLKREYQSLLKNAALVINGGCKVAGGAQVVEALLKKSMIVEALDSASVLSEWATSLLLLTQRLQRTIRERIDVGCAKKSKNGREGRGHPRITVSNR
jgi:hypothetical protein